MSFAHGMCIDPAKEALRQRLIRLALFNLLLVSALGLLLRSYPFLDHPALLYKHVLHGHSHFAFGGWVLPALMALVMKYFPGITSAITYRHWRNTALLVLVSAYGMLLFFPLYGYKGITIFFSTLSIAATTYFALIVWKAAGTVKRQTSHRFLTWGLIWATLSAIGPFATVPLILKGLQGSNLYFDLIYFYLHFQINGFFSFLVLAFVYRHLEEQDGGSIGRRAFRLFNAAIVPAFALSVLWHQRGMVWNLVGGIGAGMQLAALFYSLRDARPLLKESHLFARLAILAFCAKLVLQALSALPEIAAMAYNARNFIIAYLHLVLLGFVSLYVFGSIGGEMRNLRLFRAGVLCFLFSFVTTETILVLQAMAASFGFSLAYTPELLWVFSLFFPLGCLLMVGAAGSWLVKGKMVVGELRSV